MASHHDPKTITGPRTPIMSARGELKMMAIASESTTGTIAANHGTRGASTGVGVGGGGPTCTSAVEQNPPVYASRK